MVEKINVSTDWEIKFNARFMYNGLIVFRDKYYKYKLMGRNSSKLKANYVNKLFTLYFTVQTYFRQYLAVDGKDNDKIPSEEEYDALSETPLPDDTQLKRLERTLIDWLFTEGYFKTMDTREKRYNSIEEMYEDEA